MSARALLLTALLATVALPASSGAGSTCSAGLNCPREECWGCIPGGGGQGACCELVPQNGKCNCLAPGGGSNCVMSGQCNYGTCLIADSKGPCIWNAPPPSRRWATMRSRVHRARS